MRKLLVLLLLPILAWAQVKEVIPPATILGNSTAASALPKALTALPNSFVTAATPDLVTPSDAASDRTLIGATQSFENGVVQEPSVWFFNGFYHMIYTAGWTNPTLGYAYATKPSGPWTHLAAAVIGNGAGGTTAGQYVAHTGTFIEGNTVYVTSSIGGTGSLILWSAPINFTPATGPTFTELGAIYALPTGYSNWGNSQIIKGGAGGTYALLAEVQLNSGNHNWQMCLATTSGSLATPATFTTSTCPLTQLASIISTYWQTAQATYTTGGPWTQDALGLYTTGSNLLTLYFHGGPTGTQPTEIFRATSPVNDLVNWTSLDNGYPIYQRKLAQEVDQVGDAALVRGPGGEWSFFSTATDDLNATDYIVETPALATLTVSSNGAAQVASKASAPIIANSTYFNPALILSTSVTSWSAKNHDDIEYNLGVNNLAVTLPRASIGAVVRISAYNGAATNHVITVSKNASDFFNYNGSASPTSVKVYANRSVTFYSPGVNHWTTDGNYGVQNAPSGAPTISACGTSPTVDANSSNSSGTVTAGTGTVTSCTITFAIAYGSWAHCNVTPESSTAAFAYSNTKSAITLTATSLTSGLFDYRCDGY